MSEVRQKLVAEASELLATSRFPHGAPSPEVSNALRQAGVNPNNVDGKGLQAAQERLLTAMEETQKAAGHPGALLRAFDLGEAAAKLQGELPPAELRKILADSTSGSWAFVQGEGGTIRAVPAAPGVSREGMPSMTRADIANRVAGTFDNKVGMEVLADTLNEAK